MTNTAKWISRSGAIKFYCIVLMIILMRLHSLKQQKGGKRLVCFYFWSSYIITGIIFNCIPLLWAPRILQWIIRLDTVGIQPDYNNPVYECIRCARQLHLNRSATALQHYSTQVFTFDENLHLRVFRFTRIWQIIRIVDRLLNSTCW